MKRDISNNNNLYGSFEIQISTDNTEYIHIYTLDH